MTAPAVAALSIDGRFDEPEWRAAKMFDEFLQIDPETREAAPYPTQARVVALQEGLAVGISATLPRALRTYGRSPRDADRMDADPVRIAVDFDGTGRTAYEFTVSLSGSVRDGVFLNQNQYSADWDSTWFHAVAEDDTAWHVELLIPWSVVPASERAEGDRTIGIWIVRFIKRLGRGFAFPALAPNRPTFVSDFHKMSVPRYSAAALDWFPYALVSVDQLADSSKGRAGLDVQWKNESGGQFTATVNPDFGQVESDDLVVNFSAFETFFSEKRPFFTENQQLFDLRTPTDGRLVNTRRIGAASDGGDGGATDIIGAAKYTAAAGTTDYGVFTAFEDDTGDIEGRSYFVGRVRQRANKWTYGYLGTFTDRPAIDRQAQVHALDADWQPTNGVRVRSMVFSSLIDAAGARDGAGAFAIVDYDRGGRLRNESSFTWFDRNLEINDLGFLPRRNMQRLRTRTTLTKRDYPADSSRALSDWSLEVDARRSDIGDWLSSRVGVFRQVRLRTPTSYEYYCIYNTRGIDDLITRGNGPVETPGRIDCGAEYQRQPGPRWRYELGVFVYEEGVRGGLTQEIYFSPRFIVTPNLSTEFSLSYQDSPDWFIYLPSNRQLASFARRFTEVTASFNWYPGRKQELRAKLQFVGLTANQGREYIASPQGNLASTGAAVQGFRQGEIGFQLRYRYELKPLSELFVVYSRGGRELERGERGLGGLWSAAVDQKTADQFLVKLRYRFQQ